jgi:hypothetical protein
MRVPYTRPSAGCLYSMVDYHAVACAAAGVAVLLEPVPHVFPGRAEIAVKERLGGDDEARSTESALDGVVENERLLNRVEIEGGADPFYGGDLGPAVDPLHLQDAGAYQFAVQDHIARAALAVAAADLCPGQMELPAQHIGQEGFLVNDQRPLYAIDLQYLFNHSHTLSSIKLDIIGQNARFTYW